MDAGRYFYSTRVQQGSFTIPMERIGTIKVMYRATPVARARVKAKTIYQPGFVVQLQRRRQRIGFKTQQHNANTNTMCCS